VAAPIAAGSGPDCDWGILTRKHPLTRLLIATVSFATRPPRTRHIDAALARTLSLFRFASVASGPRFSHDPVNLAPDCDG